MHVNQERIITINLKQLVLIITVNVNRVTDINMLVRQNVMGFVELITWGKYVMNFQILFLFLFIKSEVEILL